LNTAEEIPELTMNEQPSYDDIPETSEQQDE
jgi:hypothetical protein